jgi:hypothetical protein
MTEIVTTAENDGTALTRFNALRHGILSRYTVLPWEDADEYRTLVAAAAFIMRPTTIPSASTRWSAASPPAARAPRAATPPLRRREA